MSESRDAQQQRRGVFTTRSPIRVLYIASTTEPQVAPSSLQGNCGLNIEVVTSPPAVLFQEADPGFDCVVIESSGGSKSESIVTKCVEHSPEVSVIVYAHPRDRPETYRDFIEDGVVEYLPRAADTDDKLLLRQRIEQCVELECERATARELRTAVDQLGHSVLIANDNGRIEYVNRAFEKFGYTPEDLEGQPLASLRCGNDVSSTVSFFETVTEGEPWSGELTIETPAGERVIALTTTQHRRDDDTQWIVAVGDDITERKRREKRLRSFEKAVEQAGHVIMITDPDGKIEYVNPAFEEVTGYDSQEALGARPNLLKSDDHDESFYEGLWETIRSGEVWQGELVNERKNGEQYHIRQTISPVTDASGDIERYVAVNTDITDKKRHEQQIERERNRLDEFAQTVAHDLRNPLSIALGNLELVQEESKIRQEAVERAMRALERMEALIDEVLTLSKQGQTIHEPESTRPVRIIRRAWESVETQSATLVIENELEGWSLRADESRLCELLENLFRNAVEHGTTSTSSQNEADPGSDLTVRVGRLESSQGFFIADDGPGIPPSDRNQVCEGGFTTADNGTGFGLAIVAQIVEAHGWQLNITESRTSGAKFEITTGGDPSRPERGGES